MPGWLRLEQVAGLRRNRWPASSECAYLARALRRIESREEMAFAVARLERWQREARERLENRLTEAQAAAAESSYTAPTLYLQTQLAI